MSSWELVGVAVFALITFLLVLFVSFGNYVEDQNEACQLQGHDSAKLINWKTVCADISGFNEFTGEYYYTYSILQEGADE